MTDVKAASAETILPNTWTVTIGEETFSIRTFALAKTIKTFALIGEIVERSDIGKVVSSVEAADTEQSTPSFVAQALLAIPRALRDGTPAIYKLIGLIVTPNSKLRQMDENDDDIDGYLLTEGRRLAYEGTTEQVMNAFAVAVQAIGVETVLAQLPKLTRMLVG